MGIHFVFLPLICQRLKVLISDAQKFRLKMFLQFLCWVQGRKAFRHWATQSQHWVHTVKTTSRCWALLPLYCAAPSRASPRPWLQCGPWPGRSSRRGRDPAAAGRGTCPCGSSARWRCSCTCRSWHSCKRRWCGNVWPRDAACRPSGPAAPCRTGRRCSAAFPPPAPGRSAPVLQYLLE